MGTTVSGSVKATYVCSQSAEDARHLSNVYPACSWSNAIIYGASMTSCDNLFHSLMMRKRKKSVWLCISVWTMYIYVRYDDIVSSKNTIALERVLFQWVYSMSLLSLFVIFVCPGNRPWQLLLPLSWKFLEFFDHSGCMHSLYLFILFIYFLDSFTSHHEASPWWPCPCTHSAGRCGLTVTYKSYVLFQTRVSMIKMSRPAKNIVFTLWH